MRPIKARSLDGGTNAGTRCPKPIMPLSSRALADAVSRAAERAAVAVRQEMKRGLNTLATIVSVAPWLGLLMTVIGIVGSFVGCGGDKSTCMAAIVDRLANTIARSVLGLLVGMIALCFYRYLLSQLEGFDIEMWNMALELTNAVSLCLRRDQAMGTSPPVSKNTPNSSRRSSSNGRPTS